MSQSHTSHSSQYSTSDLFAHELSQNPEVKCYTEICKIARNHVQERDGFVIGSSLYTQVEPVDMPYIITSEHPEIFNLKETNNICKFCDQESKALSQLSTFNDKLSSTQYPDFHNGNGYIQHTSADIKRFIAEIAKLFEMAELPVEAAAIKKAGLSYIFPNDISCESVRKRLECIDPSTLREWGNSYVARDISDNTPFASGMMHRVVKAIESDFLLPAGREPEIATVTSTPIYSSFGLSFKNAITAETRARSFVSAATLLSMIPSPKFSSLSISNFMFEKPTTGPEYFAHDKDKIGRYENVLAIASYDALSATQYSSTMATPTVSELKRNLLVIARIFNDYGNPLLHAVERLSRIDDAGNEWNSTRAMSIQGSGKGAEVDAKLVTYEKALVGLTRGNP